MFLLLLGATIKSEDDVKFSLQNEEGKQERERRKRRCGMYEMTQGESESTERINMQLSLD